MGKARYVRIEKKSRQVQGMKKIARILCIVMAVTVLFSGCGETEAEEGSVKIYYAAIESGDYYEGWANQLKEQADINGWEFEVGYAEKSLETQISQLKGAVEDGYNVFSPRKLPPPYKQFRENFPLCLSTMRRRRGSWKRIVIFMWPPMNLWRGSIRRNTYWKNFQAETRLTWRF